MEVLAITTTVCALCKGIHLWIDEQAQKEALLSQIASSVLQIHNILQPFASAEFKGNGEAQLSDSIRSIGDVLQRTKEHLVVWKSKRSQKLVAFLNPTALIAQLRDDEMQLNRQLIILLTSIAVVGYFRDHATKAIADRPLLEEQPPPYSTDKDGFGPLEQLDDVDAREFWRDYVGAKVGYATTLFIGVKLLTFDSKVEFVGNDVFCSRLMSWNTAIPQGTMDRILMRLDEYNSGGVTPYNLTRVLGNMSLKEFVESYSRGAVHFLQFPYLSCSCGEQIGEKPAALDASLIQAVPGHELRTPLLVWIDDRPENNAYEVAQARGMGIYVIEMMSTAMAKAWIDANLCKFIFSFICPLKY